MLDVVTMGEVMVQFNACTNGPLRHVVYFEKHAAGAEANFAIGMSRLGFKVGFITRVSNDEFGKYILGVLRSEGIDVSRVKVDHEARSGIYFIQRNYPIPGRSSVIYYRKESAASRLSVDDIDPDYIRKAKLFHLTGITPALSKSCREASFKALDVAYHSNMKISIDTNIRLGLWSREEARETLMPMLKKANIILIEPQDAEILLKKREPKEIAEDLLSMGAEIVVVKLGAEGAFACTEDEEAMKPAFRVPIVDVTGAGDAFAAGFISSLMRGKTLEEALEAGNAAGALAITVKGDFENIPSHEDLEKFLAAQKRKTIILR